MEKTDTTFFLQMRTRNRPSIALFLRLFSKNIVIFLVVHKTHNIEVHMFC